MPYRSSAKLPIDLSDRDVARFGEAMRRARRGRQGHGLALLSALLSSAALLSSLLGSGPSAGRADAHLERGGGFLLPPSTTVRRLPVRAAFHMPCGCIPVTDEREGARLQAAMGRDCGPWYD